MLGYRGCRLGLSYPSIYRVQVAAVITASATLINEGTEMSPEIMIPLTVDVQEMERLRADLTTAKQIVQDNLGVTVPYKFGTMIEIPRAALTAGQIARGSEIFSFGTNDLTQMTSVLAGTTRNASSSENISTRASCRPTPSPPWTLKALVPWCAWR